MWTWLVTSVHNRYRWGAFSSAGAAGAAELSPWRGDPALPQQPHAASGVQHRYGGSHARLGRLAAWEFERDR